ncbi:MAG: MATE family efflux transporter [Lachnospiraceae bacterium]|nr:MATE family efflux transporter [Lachnospiraceae bacterium]
MRIQLSEHFTYKKLLRFSLPTIAMMIFTSIYCIVDGFFVSNFVGKTAFAAVNLIMPYLMIQGCFGFMIGTGGGALVAKTLGEGKRETADRYFTMLVCFTTIMGLVISAVSIVFMRPVVLFLGAEGAMVQECVTYGIIISAFNAAFMLQYFFQSFFVVAEKPNLGFGITMAAGLTNIVLDAVFIAGFHWGVAGAAAAAVIGQCVGGVLPLVYFAGRREDAASPENSDLQEKRRRKPALKNTSLLQLRKTKMEASVLWKTCGNGSSELMSNISASFVGMLYNFQLMRYAGENGIAAYGVVMYTQMIFFAIYIGYAVGTSPIMSYHYGAGNHGEMRSLLRKSLSLMAGTGVVMMLSAQASASVLSGIFVGYDAELLEITAHAFVIFACSYLLSGVNIYASSFFTALNNGGVSAAISFMRTLIFQTGAVLLLPFLLGIDGIWWAVTVSEVMACLISAAFLAAKRKKYHY